MDERASSVPYSPARTKTAMLLSDDFDLSPICIFKTLLSSCLRQVCEEVSTGWLFKVQSWQCTLGLSEG